MSLKSLATGVAAVAVAVGVTGLIPPSVTPVQPVVFGIPMPLDPPAAVDVPTADALVGILNGLADANVPFAEKSGLVEGGIDPMVAHHADKRLKKAAERGQLPLAFSVANITPSGPGAATSDVTVSGPQLAPQTINLTFVNQDGWKLSRSSAMTLMQTAGAA